MSGKISAQLRRPKFVRKILCCVALVYNSHTFLQTAVDWLTTQFSLVGVACKLQPCQELGESDFREFQNICLLWSPGISCSWGSAVDKKLSFCMCSRLIFMWSKFYHYRTRYILPALLAEAPFSLYFHALFFLFCVFWSVKHKFDYWKSMVWAVCLFFSMVVSAVQ